MTYIPVSVGSRASFGAIRVATVSAIHVCVFRARMGLPGRIASAFDNKTGTSVV